MATAFPDTPVTLLAKIAAQMTRQKDELSWVRFFDLYQPAIRKFAEYQGAKGDADDVTQDILLKLVDILRNGKYSADAGKFRCYLATLIRHEVIGHWRKGQARGADNHVSIDNPDAGVEIADNQDAGLALDAKWRLARHEAAVEHALCKTALAAQTKDIYRAYVLEEMPMKEVMKKFGVSEDVVYQSKTRVNKMIAVLESELGE